MPTRDRSRDLALAARSVLDQDFDDLELVIVDDGSTDGTPELAESLRARDPRVRYLRNQTPAGPCEARNRGVAASTGQFVSFCDDDDQWLPGAAARSLAFLDGGPRTVAVAAWHEVRHDDGSVVYKGPLSYRPADLLWRNFPAIIFGVLRRDAMPDGPLFDASLPTSEDWDLWLRCSMQGPVRTLPEVLYRYRQHEADRVTGTGRAHEHGRRAFLAKHRDRMTGACIAYHEAVIELLGRRRVGIPRALWTGSAHSGSDAAFGALLVSSDIVTSRLGMFRADPGLPARCAVRLLARAGPGRV